MQLIDALAVVHYLETSHHKTGNAGLVTATRPLSRWVVFSSALSLLGPHLSESFEAPLQGLHIVVSLFSASVEAH